jgi:hypothetical protein
VARASFDPASGGAQGKGLRVIFSGGWLGVRLFLAQAFWVRRLSPLLISFARRRAYASS